MPELGHWWGLMLPGCSHASFCWLKSSLPSWESPEAPLKADLLKLQFFFFWEKTVRNNFVCLGQWSEKHFLQFYTHALQNNNESSGIMQRRTWLLSAHTSIGVPGREHRGVWSLNPVGSMQLRASSSVWVLSFSGRKCGLTHQCHCRGVTAYLLLMVLLVMVFKQMWKIKKRNCVTKHSAQTYLAIRHADTQTLQWLKTV